MNCAFCGKFMDDVAVVIVEPGVNICDECVESYMRQKHKENGELAAVIKQFEIGSMGTD